MASEKTEELIEMGAEIAFLRSQNAEWSLIARALALDALPQSRNDLRISQERIEEAQTVNLNWRQLGDGRVRLDLKRLPRPKAPKPPKGKKK